MNPKKTISVTEARKRIFEIIEDVQKPDTYYTLTEKGKPKAVILSVEEFESLWETIETYENFPNLAKDIKEAEEEIARGEYVTLEDLLAKESYYKLPGGGIEDTEDKMIALARERQEEIGCDIEIIGEIGTIVEYRKIFTLKQISYCYLTKVKGEKGKADFTDDEKENGFKQIWLPYNEALKVSSENKVTNIEGSAYIVPRDTAFLQEAKNLIR